MNENKCMNKWTTEQNARYNEEKKNVENTYAVFPNTEIPALPANGSVGSASFADNCCAVDGATSCGGDGECVWWAQMCAAG